MAQPAPHIAEKPREIVIRPIVENRHARHEYFITEEIEAGIELVGTEVKSLRDKKVQLAGGFARFADGGQLYLENVQIAVYKQGNINNHDPLRTRRLLLHARELRKLAQRTATKGVTIVPLKMYFKGNKIKVLLGIAKGKRSYDKRESIKERDLKRDQDRE
jgi:SsrA-binding protein